MTMEPLLWSFEQVKPFAHHPDVPVRQWALERLTKLFPDQASEVLATMLDDPSRFIADQAIEFLGETGETERYGPPLYERLAQAEGNRFDYLALALAKLNYRPALPVILERVQQEGVPIQKLSGYSRVTEALGEFGGDEVRQAIWGWLEQKALSREEIVLLMEALLKTARPEDIARLVVYYRALPRQEGQSDPLGSSHSPIYAFAKSAQATRLFEEMIGQIDEGFEAILEQAEWWLGEDVGLSAESLSALEASFERRYANISDILFREAQRLAEMHGDDLAAWQAAWEAGERPVGYRQRVLYTWLILQALAQQPSTYLSRRKEESVLGAGLLVQWSIEQDDQARLERAEDKPETLLDILSEAREHVLPDVLERAAASGPEITPRVLERFDPEGDGWGPIRLARAIERLARVYPGSCDAFAPQLIEGVHEQQGDYLLEALADALEAIGLPALEAIENELRRTKDMSRQIYLTGVLANLPVERSAQIILEKLLSGQPIEEFELNTLTDVGSASAIEPLYQVWKPGDHILAETLLILCMLHGVEKPEIPEWRRLIEEQEVRTEALLNEDFDFLDSLKKLADPNRPSLLRTWQLESSPTTTRQAGAKKATGKKELKKRVAQRKGGKGKKKKK